MKVFRLLMAGGLAISGCGSDGTSSVPGGGSGASSLPDTGPGKGDASQPVATTGSGGMSGGGGAPNVGGSATSDAGPAPVREAGGTPAATLRIVFPPPGAVADDSIVVRGTTAFATTAFADPVASIQVNGVAATSTDAFATYRAVVPLQQGDNKIVVTVQGKSAASLGTADVTVQRFADAASIHRGGGDAFSIFRLFGFAIDAEQRQAIVCDDIFDGLVRIDLATGNRSLASASESSAKGMVGKGYNDIGQPRDVTLDTPGHALLIDGPTHVGVDLASGDRTLLSGLGTGTGPEATQFGGVGYDDGAGRAIAIDYGGNALFAIDPAHGARSVLSSTTVGTGVAFNSFGAIELDLAHGRALTTRPYANPIIAIDLKNGNRSVLSGDGAGTGPALQEPTELAIAPSLGVVLAWDSMAKHLVAIDLTTGNRRIVADGATGMGVALPSVDRLAFGQDLLYAEQGASLLAIDPVEGHRVVVSK